LLQHLGEVLCTAEEALLLLLSPSLSAPELLEVWLLWEWSDAIIFCMKPPRVWITSCENDDNEFEVAVETLPQSWSNCFQHQSGIAMKHSIAPRKSAPPMDGGEALVVRLPPVLCDWLSLPSWLSCCQYQLSYETQLIVMPSSLYIYFLSWLCPYRSAGKSPTSELSHFQPK